MQAKKRLLFIEKFRTPFRNDDDSDSFPFVDLGFEVTFRSVPSTTDILDIADKLSIAVDNFDVIVLMIESLSTNENIELSQELIQRFRELLEGVKEDGKDSVLLVGFHPGLDPKYFYEQSKIFNNFFISNTLTYEQYKRLMKDILIRCNMDYRKVRRDDLPVTLARKPIGTSFAGNHKRALYIEWPPQEDFWDCKLFQSIGFEVVGIFVDNLNESLGIENAFSISVSHFDVVVLAIAGLDRLVDTTFSKELVNQYEAKLASINQSNEQQTILIGQHLSLNQSHYQSQMQLFKGYFFTNVISDHQRDIIRKMIR